MKKVFLFSLVLVLTLFSYTQNSQSVCLPPVANVIICDANPPNPDINGVQESGNLNNLTVNVLQGAEVNTQSQPGNLDAIRTGAGNDNHNITGAIVRGEDAGIESGGGDDAIKVVDSEVTAIERAIESGNQNDTVMLENSHVESEKEIAIQTGNDNDNVMVKDSSVTGVTNDGIETANHEDQVTIEDSIITGGPGFFAVDLGNGNDTLTLRTGSDLRGGIDCRDDFDTLIFAMEVPESQLSRISAELAMKNPADDSITINGLFYEWQECEVIENQLVGVAPISNVPTLSEWGMIAMAFALGIIAIMVVRKKRAEA